jgi:CBS domain containing-hemolysin-like protein
MIAAVQMAAFAVCLAVVAFFAAAETALMSMSLSGWERWRQQAPGVLASYVLWSDQPALVVATLLFGNTLASLGASVLAGALVWNLRAKVRLPHGMAFVLSSLLAGGTILILGEILPKLYARRYHERVLLRFAGVLPAIIRALRPLLSGLVALSDASQKLLFREPAEPLITTDELRQVLSDWRAGELDPASRRMLSNIISFDQVKVADIMIPRSQVIAVALEQDTERVFSHIVRAAFSRIPVYFGNIDNILGIVYAKDLLVEWRSSGLLVLEDLLRPPYRIAPDAPVSVLLQAFRQGHHLAVVTDARGRTQGIVTVEDVVETIVGDIADEFDQPQTPY